MSSSITLAKGDRLDAPEALEDVACPLCESRDSRLCFRSCDTLYGTPGTYALVRCNGCGLKYVNPRPTTEALGKHYPPDYFASRAPEKLPPVQRWFLRNQLVFAALNRLKKIERVTGRLGPGKRLLDVGCGLNELVRQTMLLRKADGLGMDFNPAVVEYVSQAGQAPIVEGTLAAAPFGDGEFDVVSMMEYLEHEPNPREVLAQARRVLKPGGHVCVEIPYIDGPVGKVFGPRWGMLDVPRHLVFYNKETLTRTFERTGFEMVHSHTFGVPLAIGVSFAVTVGHRHLNRLSTLGGTLMALASMPFLPFLALLPEFMFAVGRAK
jgi:SAM-dependent methyltransferase